MFNPNLDYLPFVSLTHEQALQFWVECLQCKSDNELPNLILMAKGYHDNEPDTFVEVDITEDLPSNITDGSWTELQLWL